MELLKSGLEEDFRGYLSGKVVDEADGDGISGLTVELRRHKGITTGTAIATVTSGADGTYEFDDLDVDQYTLRVVDNRNNAKSKYATCSVNVCVNSVSTEKNITTSATSDSDEIRFVLKWGEGDDAPKDLDSYLYGPRVNDLGTFELSYGQYYGIAGKTYAKVIADSSSHKETATIVEPTDGIYYYYVYCSSDDENTPMFDTSDAVVEVYAGTELLETYNVPVDGNSTDCWWSVCSYDSRTGQLTSGDGLMEYKPAFGILYSGYENLVTKVYSSKSSCLKDDETQIDAPDYTGVGNIYLYGDESWSVVEDTLQYDTVSGYTAEFNEESEPTDEDYYVGKILVKDENGDVVNSYKLYYEKVVELSVVGDYKSYGIARIDIDGKYMAIFMPKAPDNKAEIMDELEFKCSDSSYTSFDYDSGTGVLSVSDGLNPKYFYVSFESNYYITDVKSSGESIEYCEYSKMMNIVAPTPESTDNLQVECVAGYSAEIISEGNTVFKLKITTDDELGESDPVIKDVDFTGVVESAVKLTVEDYSELGVTRVVINDDANSVKIYVPDTNVDDVNELINTLPFGASDESYEVTVPDLEEPTLRLSDGDSTVDYSVECITGCYITDVWDSQGVVTKWEEDSDHLEIYVDTTENDISDIEGTIELYFDCVDGYKVEIDDEDDTLLNITNVQSGDVIEKHFSLAPNNG
jgi:hypothetical protein